ncbi:histidine kinase [Sphingomonas sp. 1185]|uniref:histidine kinase n=1 Tax=Sphingomonas sp. 1185 TaxID=3156411 RepID=UPI003396BA7F
MTQPIYRIVAQPRAWTPVTFPVVMEDGTVQSFTIEMRFRLLKVDAATAFIAEVVRIQALEEEAGADHAQLYTELVAQIATDWRGVHAENGDPLRFDVPENWLTDLDAEGNRKPLVAPNLRSLMNEGGMFIHIFDAFRACLAGQPKARAGN